MKTLIPPTLNRRQSPRVRLSPMYSRVVVETKPKGVVSDSHLPEPREGLHGHAYDLSESGVRIELDQPLTIGQPVHVRLEVAGAVIDASADVMWVNDAEDDPGPRRMALRFTAFSTSADRLRLERFIENAITLAA